jgi:thiamine-phosphate pyrophosphorylase
MVRGLRGLYAITPSDRDPATLVEDCRGVLANGARVLQYRTDRAADEALALELLALCRERGALFIVNDDAKLAARIGADGVHLGRHDESIAIARATLGPGAIIGASCYDDLSRARRAQQQGADYLAFGAVLPSRTKPDAIRAPLNVLSEARPLGLPIVAVGGITLAAAPDLIEAGADLLAVIDDLFHHPLPAARAAAFAACFAATDDLDTRGERA